MSRHVTLRVTMAAAAACGAWCARCDASCVRRCSALGRIRLLVSPHRPRLVNVAGTATLPPACYKLPNMKSGRHRWHVGGGERSGARAQRRAVGRGSQTPLWPAPPGLRLQETSAMTQSRPSSACGRPSSACVNAAMLFLMGVSDWTLKVEVTHERDMWHSTTAWFANMSACAANCTESTPHHGIHISTHIGQLDVAALPAQL